MEESIKNSTIQEPTAKHYTAISGQPINKPERATQNRVLELFEGELDYTYLGI